ncbi:hypothetical protein CSUI_007463 [Cystoisospora suis]|uniref:Transmembrane protein n=1 Tax=Cystoisospora suis TaxID=483139 RepID=A0A2C6KDY6_9APIC|nr:hypothetical protein CSUI_007463 [Cystoisospora suis]
MFSQLPSFSFPFFSSSGEGERREEEKEERERERYEESPTFSPSSGGVFSSSSSQSPRVGWLEVNEEETHKEEEKKIGEERRKEEGEEKSEKEEEEEKRGGRVVLLNDSDTSLHAALLVLKYSRPLSELFCTLLLIILLLLLTILYMYRQVRFYKYAVSRTVFMEDREEGEGRDRSIRKLFSVGLLTASPPHTEEGGVHTLDETTGDRQYLQNDHNAESRRKNRKKNRLDEDEVSMHAQAGGGEEEEEIKESGCGGGRLKILQEGRRSLSSQSREVGDMSRHLLQHDSVAPSY